MTDFEKLEALRAEAMRLAELHPEVEQVTVIQTAKKNIHFMLDSPRRSHYDASASEPLMDALRDSCDTHVLLIVCLVYGRKGWEVDLPTISFRARLLELDSRNTGALMMLYGEHGRHPRDLYSTLPASMQKKYPL